MRVISYISCSLGGRKWGIRPLAHGAALAFAAVTAGFFMALAVTCAAGFLAFIAFIVFMTFMLFIAGAAFIAFMAFMFFIAVLAFEAFIAVLAFVAFIAFVAFRLACDHTVGVWKARVLWRNGSLGREFSFALQ